MIGLFLLILIVLVGSLFLYILEDCCEKCHDEEYTYSTSNSDGNYKIGNTYDAELPMPNIECRKSAFKVQYICGDNGSYVRLSYVSNNNKFLNSEIYTNKSFGKKKAEQLAEELNTEVIYLDERN